MQKSVTTHTEILHQDASRLENLIRNLSESGKQEILDTVFDAVCELANQRKYEQAGLILRYITKTLKQNRGS